MDREKYVDESWKESAELEKEKLRSVAGAATSKSNPDPARSSSNEPSSEPEQVPADESPESSGSMNFLNYLSSLAYQAMVFLGEIPNPMTNMPETNVEQAKFIIDTLLMLREKTKGNLTKKENDILNTSIYQLQMKYVEVCQKEGVL